MRKCDVCNHPAAFRVEHRDERDAPVHYACEWHLYDVEMLADGPYLRFEVAP